MEIADLAGPFAEDKDVAREIRTANIIPAVRSGRRVVLDFDGVDVATQSFVHALISECIRSQKKTALKLIEFKSCQAAVKDVILTVVDYSLEMAE